MQLLFSVLTQSYYPLYPPVEEVNMDYEKFQSFGQMPLTPDVLIIPSELRYFVKVHTPRYKSFQSVPWHQMSDCMFLLIIPS